MVDPFDCCYRKTEGHPRQRMALLRLPRRLVYPQTTGDESEAYYAAARAGRLRPVAGFLAAVGRALPGFAAVGRFAAAGRFGAALAAGALAGVFLAGAFFAGAFLAAGAAFLAAA